MSCVLHALAGCHVKKKQKKTIRLLTKKLVYNSSLTSGSAAAGTKWPLAQDNVSLGYK